MWRLIAFIVKSLINLGLISVCLVGLVNLFVIMKAQPQTISAEEVTRSNLAQDDVPILVLGAGIIENKEPSQVLAKRLDAAFALAEAFPHKVLIMSGDHESDYYNEVAVMKAYLVSRGVASERIYLDHAGYSTYDSLYRLKHVLNQKKVIIVTQGYHLSRALMLARGMGVEALGLSADEVKSTRLQREIRELGARLKDFAVTYLGYPMPQPTSAYPIDFSQSGDATNQVDLLPHQRPS